MNPLLNIAIKAARRAGQTLLRHFDRLERIVVEQKGPGDFVSAVDRMAEDDIVDIVRAKYPNHRIIAEERGIVEGAAGGQDAGADDAADADAKSDTDAKSAAADAKSGAGAKSAAADAEQVEWLIDPLDGTTNYLHGHPHFAVSIAARQHGQVQHAVVFDPLRDEMFTASRGQGAHLNRRRIRVGNQRRLKRCLLASGVHYHDRSAAGRARFEAWRRTYDALLPQTLDIRRGGSAALDLCYVACGRLDGYWQPGLAAWDAAAGSLLVREAGGFVADFHGRQQFLESGEIIASNPLIFNQLLVTLSATVASVEGAPGAADSTEAAATTAAESPKNDAKTVAKSPAKTGRKSPTKTVAKSTTKTGRKSTTKTAANA
ncbi:MAG: inositol monophosphatase family protein [Gammaproteobacteria bacterium]|nr:inositol monophosphatase family protein [Gammaproteobacteria bacterium]